MHKLLPVIAAMLLLVACQGSPDESREGVVSEAPPPRPAVTNAPLEVGCATCVFGMAGIEGCLLAVKVDAKPYLVSGVEMPGHETGLCDHSRIAKLSGGLEGERFVATSFELVP